MGNIHAQKRANLPHMTLQEVRDDPRVLLIMDNKVLDATDFVKLHPGGEGSILKRAQSLEDCKQDYRFHSACGRKMFRDMHCAWLDKDPRPKRKISFSLRASKNGAVSNNGADCSNNNTRKSQKNNCPSASPRSPPLTPARNFNAPALNLAPCEMDMPCACQNGVCEAERFTEQREFSPPAEATYFNVSKAW